MRRLELIAATLLALLYGGCGQDGYAALGLVEVTGTITLDGKPLAGAKVSFEGDHKRLATSVTDSAGRYALTYDSETRGALPGPKTVRITLADTDVEGGGAGEGAASAKESIPARYNRQSELNADVSAANRTFDFSLKSTP